MLTGERVSLLGGEFTADLRIAPARLCAVVPLTHAPLPPPADYAFGLHVRDIADGRTAALTAFNGTTTSTASTSPPALHAGAAASATTSPTPPAPPAPASPHRASTCTAPSATTCTC
ncbi:hypothetical protein QF035_000319 [Streptomyces umbrinus]|uniref:Uncharacterized protein n=1 Tax=Streptomyces umbrinus TaxID=67370 RepID=A0ABU0SH20_9ACTN|nr:hypothetical protein [Streptomyces umbrinus]MDQ1022737.1 hypothetical protein [Streptomyces umbrinus]